MAGLEADKKYLIVSVVAHIAILLVLVLGIDHTSLIPVFENTNKNDVISAVVLGDVTNSKIVPKQPTPPPPPVVKPEPPKPVAQKPAPIEKDVIALKKAEDKKKLEQKKALEALKKPNIFGKDLLADIKKQKVKKQDQLKTQFQKTLFEQAEKTLRQDLLNEELKIQGTISRQAQGEVNKYKALIVQAIGQKWIVPMQANKRLYTELMIRVAPGGRVMDVQITKTSGDPSLDSSARMAVMRASPLPVPQDANAFSAFKQFVLKVKPENVMDM